MTAPTPHKATAHYLGGTRFAFQHPCGHRSTKDYSKGPVSKRMGAAGCKLMARWWSRGTVFAPCSKCFRRVGASWVRR